MGGAASNIVRMARIALEDDEAGRRQGVLNGSFEQTDSCIILAHQHVPELMGQPEDADGSHRIDEQ